MQIAYYDETGDDGYPNRSSEFFVLSAIYFHYLNWKPMFNDIVSFRKQLRDSYGLPIKTEMHTNRFLNNKHPYRSFNISDSDRLTIIDLYCDLIASLDLKIINVVIVKPRIRQQDYKVLDRALVYSIQRIENDLNPAQNPNEKFMIITDPGRVGMMMKTSRRIQKINYIQSRFGPHSYRREIRSLIEDPLPKDSKESYFIQLSDTVSFIVYLHSVLFTGISSYSSRLQRIITPQRVQMWMDRLLPSLNCNASRSDPYGIVYHPS